MPATPRATRWTGARLDDVPAGRALDDPRLGLVVRLVIIVSLAVVPLDAVLYLATGHPILLAKGLALAALAAWTAWAWPRMSRRNVSSFVGLLSIGIIAVVVVIAQLLPELALGMPAAALIPVVLALPFMSGRPLIRLMAVAWIAMIVVAIVAELGLTASGLPVWAVSVLRVTNAASIGTLSLLLLWQYRSRLLESNRELNTLVGMSRELSTTLDPQRIGHLMAEHLALATGADACLISSWDRVADRVETFGRYPLEQIPGTSDSYALDEYPETRRVLDDQVVVMVDLADRDADPAETAYLRTIGQRRSAMLPLIAKGETIGLIELSVASDERFDERALRVASTLAAEAAMALENARLYQELRHQAFHDGLTRLANRALFNDRLEHALARGARTGSPLAILFVDLDDFKTVNDRMGHARGDQLLYEVAERLRSCLRTGDTAARLGGDEFCVLLEDLEKPLEAEIVARRILDSIAEPVRIGGSEVTVDASIGIAVSGGGGSTADELLRNADFAMYRAKSLGKGRAEVFRPGMRVGASERRQLESLLQGAVERSELRLQYQPVVDLESGSLTGFEALVRWQQPGHGMRMPADFISIAEDTGLIVSMGRWVLTEACRQAGEWQRRARRPDLSVSVNLSARQFQHPALAADIAEALRAAGLHPSSLTVEITESVLMQHTPTTVATLERLRRTGIRVAIDDFGTGYSSLSYLQRFPIDVLKVDRSFVQDATLDGEDSVLARAIVEIGSALRLSVIAEGIERREQLAALRAFGCSQGQGYLFAPPLDASDAERLLESDLRPWASLMADTSPGPIHAGRGARPKLPSMVSAAQR